MNYTPASGSPNLPDPNAGTEPKDGNDGGVDEKPDTPVMSPDVEINVDESYFIRNDGQWDSGLEYIGTTSLGSIGFASDGVFMNVVEDVKEDGTISGHVIKLNFEDANPVNPEGIQPLVGKHNYMIGSKSNWVTGVPTFSGVAYRGLWDGIDLVYSYNEGIKYDIILKPGADPSNVRIRVMGGDTLSVKEGNLVIDVKEGLTIVDQDLKMWYNDGTNDPIEGKIVLVGSDMYSFELVNYDRSRGAVIDPLYYSTFLGGYPTDYGYDVAVDQYGYAYVTGIVSTSAAPDFPTTTGAYVASRTTSSGQDAFVTKLNKTGNSLVYSTFIGGWSTDFAYGIAVDLNGCAYITGYTNYYSTTNGWPVTPGAFQTTFKYPSFTDTFVTKFNAAGSALVYSTLLGGAYYDYGYDIEVDPAWGDAVITGQTQYTSSYASYGDYPTTAGAFQATRITTSGTPYDAIVTKVNPTGTALVFSTFLGGGYQEYGYGVTVIPNGRVAVTGYSTYSASYPQAFPTTAGAYQTTRKSNSQEAYATVFEKNGAIVYSTLMGGTSTDSGYGIDFDTEGRVVIAGTTVSSNFPTTSGAYSTTISGTDYFITKFNPTGTALVWSTFLGGSSTEYMNYNGLKVGNNNKVYIAGYTLSTNYPVLYPIKPALSSTSYYDGVITCISELGTTLEYSTYFGGGYYEYVYGMDIDINNVPYVTGYTYYTSSVSGPYGEWMTTPGAFQMTRPKSGTTFSTYDPFVIKFGASSGTPPTIGSLVTSTSKLTTDDDTVLNLTVTDSDGVDPNSVYLYYMYFSPTITYGSEFLNVKMTLTSANHYVCTVRPGATWTSVRYFFQAADTKGAMVMSALYLGLVYDNDKPVIGADTSDAAPKTDTTYTFKIASSDNVGIYAVYVEYWIGTGTHINISMPASTSSSYSFMFPETLSNLNYFFSIRDAYGNFARTTTKSIAPTDASGPKYSNIVWSPSTITNGDTPTISVDVKDVSGVNASTVMLYYKDITAATYSSATMTKGSGNTFSATITVTSVYPINYYFVSLDTLKNTGTSTTYTKTVRDNVPPTISADNSDPVAYAGKTFTFRADVSDNIQLARVRAYYWFGSDPASYVTMSGSTTFTASTTVTNALTTMTYYIEAYDIEGNSAKTTNVVRTIVDNTAPTFSTIVWGATTTGDSATVTVDITDLSTISSATLYYKKSTDPTYTTSATMSFVSGITYTATISIGTDWASMNYYFTAIDAAANTGTSSPYTRTITDNDVPIFGSDTTDATANTEQSFTFRCSGSDNIGITQAQVTFWYGAGSPLTYTMTLSAGVYSYSTTIQNTLSTLSYYFTLRDAASNALTTSTSTKTPVDLSGPTFSNVASSPYPPTTGDSAIITVDVADNTGVSASTVTLYYKSSGSSTYSSAVMSFVSGITYSVSLPAGSSWTGVDYYFSAADTLGNTRSTSPATIPVDDNDAAAFGTDSTDATAYTEQTFTFSATGSDNIGIADVYVFWTFDSWSTYDYDLMSGSGTGPYTYSITIPNSLATMDYEIDFYDANYNWDSGSYTTGTRNPVDASGPTFSNNVVSPNPPTTGDSASVSIDLADLTSVSGATLYYRNTGGSYTSTAMAFVSGSTYSASITIGSGWTGLNYYVVATDSLSNSRTSSTWTISVYDNDAPVFGTDSTDATAYTEQSFTFRATGSDNIGVAYVTVSYTTDGVNWYGYYMSGSGTGPYTYTMTYPNDLTGLQYYIDFYDANWNWDLGSYTYNTLTPVDASGPTFGSPSWSPAPPTTGDSATVSIAVTDLTSVSTATLWYTNTGSSSYTSTTMSLVGGSYQATITVGSSWAGISYYVVAVDSLSNSRTSSTFSQSVSDNDAPVFGSDTTDATANTGQSFVFRCTGTDNIAITQVQVNYWYGTGPTTTETMTLSGGVYSFTHTVLNTLLVLSYTFTIRDAAANSITTTPAATRNPVDMSPPTFGGIWFSPDPPTTGDSETISVVVEDISTIASVTLYYKGILDSTYSSASMTYGSGVYSATITIGHWTSMNYYFVAVDTPGNTKTGTPVAKSVSDNDLPTLVSDTSDTTGSTESNFAFRATVSDNMGISLVRVSFWYGSAVSGPFYTMTGVTPYIYRTVTDSIGPLYYLIEITDSSGNVYTTSTVTITLTDKSAPKILNPVLNPTSPTTGDSLTITADISDQTGVSSVTLYYKSSYTSTFSSNAMTFVSGTTYSATITVGTNWVSMNYYFVATDTLGYVRTTDPYTVSVLDNDIPSIVSDTSDASAKTETMFIFKVRASDNVRVQTVYVSYWYDPAISGSLYTMTAMDGYYQYSIVIPDSLNKLNYYFQVMDGAGNSVVGTTASRTPTDGGGPIFSVITWTPVPPTTGESLKISVNITDTLSTVNVNSAVLWYKSGLSSVYLSIPMTPSLNTYSATITVGSTWRTLDFYFVAADTIGNSRTSSTTTVTVVDNDKPVPSGDASDEFAISGRTFVFRGSVLDNVQVTVAKVDFWYNTGGELNMTMTGSASPYMYQYSMPTSALTLYYFFYYQDGAGNWAKTSTYSRTIVDMTAPSFFGYVFTPSTLTRGLTTNISGVISDTSGIKSGSVQFYYRSNLMTQYYSGMMTASTIPNYYNYTFQVGYDWSTVYFYFTVIDNAGNPAQFGTYAQSVTLETIKPVFVSDTSDAVAMTERTFVFRGMATDNVQVTTYKVNYWYGTGTSGSNVSMSGSGPWTYSLTIPNSLSKLSYFFYFADSSGNWIRTATTTRNPVDMSGPTYGSAVFSPTTTYTGDAFTVSVDVIDLTGVSGSTVTMYYRGQTTSTYTSLVGTWVSGNTYSWSLTAGTDWSTLYYYFVSQDTLANSRTSSTFTRSISDNDKPVFGSDLSDTTANTEQNFVFRATVTDNRNAFSVYRVNYWYASEAGTNVSMSGTTGSYSLTRTISNRLDVLSYFFYFADSSGNWIRTATFTRTPVDKSGPTYGTPTWSPSTLYTGDTHTVSVDLTDLTGVTTTSGLLYYKGTAQSSYTSVALVYPGVGTTYSAMITVGTDWSGMNYYFYATDTLGNARTSSINTVTVSDNDKPVFGTDGSDSIANTESSFVFRATVTDNKNAFSAYKVNYWYGSGSSGTNQTMSGGAGSYTFTITIPNSLLTLNYFFYFQDTGGNWIRTTTFTRTPVDKSGPTYGSPTWSPTTLTTGDSATVSIDISDLTAVSATTAKLYYKSSSASTYSSTAMTYSGSGNTYTATITVGSGYTLMNYYFTANDTIGNSRTTSTFGTSVVDNDKPVFGSDTSDTVAKTGENFVFRVSTTDNIISYNYVEYWFGTGAHTNVSIGTSSPAILTIPVPGSLETLYYFFSFRDNRPNWVKTSTVSLAPVGPAFKNPVWTPTTPTTGETAQVSIDITDNTGVNSATATLYYKGYSDSTYLSMLMTPPSTGSTFTATITVNSGWAGINYYFTAQDTLGNMRTSITRSQATYDNDRPSFVRDDTDVNAYTSTTFTFRPVLTDNLPVSAVYVEYWFGTGSHTNRSIGASFNPTYSMIMTSTVTYMTYFFSIRDSGSNWLRTQVYYRWIIDTVNPSISGISYTPTTMTTGDPVTFSVTMSDNVLLNASATLMWYKSTVSTTYTSVLMPWSSGTTYKVTITTGATWTGINYYFTAADVQGNAITSSTFTQTVFDNDAPSFLMDTSDTSPRTGDPFSFRVTLNDNIMIDYAEVEYWYGSGLHNTLMLTLTGPGYGVNQTGTVTMNVQYYTMADLSYRFLIRDKAQNSFITTVTTLFVEDNDVAVVYGTQTWNAYTGDPFYFQINIRDNIDVSNLVEVHVLWCYALTWTSALNMTLTHNLANDRWESANIPGGVQLNSLDPITYRVTAKDHQGNWLETSIYSHPVLDNDLPTFTSEQSQARANAGDPKLFEYKVTLDDNIAVGRVYVENWYDDGSKPDFRPLSILVGKTWTVKGPIENTTATMHYKFHYYDTSNNYAVTMNFTRDPFDNQYPRIFNDMSEIIGESGHKYNFRVMVTDNIELRDDTVKVNYWIGAGAPTQMDMARITGDIFGVEVTLPNIIGTMTYNFTARDWMNYRNFSVDYTVPVVDVELPTIGTPSYAPQATTGDDYIVSALITDDGQWAANGQWMLYYFGDEMPNQPSKALGIATATNTYAFTAKVPNQLEDIHFALYAKDLQGNMQSTPFMTVPVVDNDIPVVIKDLTTANPVAGTQIVFAVEASDNIALQSVFVSYLLPDGTDLDSPCSFNGQNYSYSLMLSNNHKGDMVYTFRLADSSGNVFVTEPMTLTVKDDELPIASIVSPDTAKQNEPVFFDGTGTYDNVGIMNWTWLIDGKMFYTPSVTYAFTKVGTYTISLTVIDDPDHPAVTAEKTILIIDSEAPIASAVVPERIGNHEVLVANATGSTDNVGIQTFAWTLFLPDGSRITGEGPIFSYDMTGTLGTARLRLEVFDAQGNRDAESYLIIVVDLLAPSVIAPDDVHDYEGTALKFTDTESTDNVGIVDRFWNITWSGGYKTIAGKSFTYYFDLPGIYNITLTCIDYAGNEGSDFFIVTIDAKTEKFDTDGDGMPDAWEDLNGLDKTINDSARDPDGDSLTNLEEYGLNTKPMMEDTDSDGLPDNWESMYNKVKPGQFDPVSTNNADQDPDDDGDSNIVEYTQGNRDPTVADAPKKKEDKTASIIIAIVVALIVVLILLAGAIYFFTRLPTVDENFPENEYPHLHKKE